MIEIIQSIIKEGLFNNFIVFAYIDPGSGSILLQFLIATLVGAAFYFRRFIANIVHLIREKLLRKSK